MPSQKHKENPRKTLLGLKGPEASETAWEDPWEATKAAREVEVVYTREAARGHLKTVGSRITDEINRDPQEVKRLRAAIREADEGKQSPVRRRRATKRG